VVRVFDQLIYNVDRNLGNLLIEKNWAIWMIDHTRGFKIFKDIKTPKNLGTRCEKDFLNELRTLDKAALQPLMKDLLTDSQVDAMLARRDLIVRHFDTQVAALGEAAVLYDDPPHPWPPVPARIFRGPSPHLANSPVWFATGGRTRNEPQPAPDDSAVAVASRGDPFDAVRRADG
jgi:hypothetical protein